MQVFNYAFNLGGDFSVKMEGMSEAMGEFNANISATQQGIGKITQTLATFNIATDFFTNISEAFSGITEAGSNAELQLMNLKTLFGGNAEAAEEMYERISEYGKVTPYNKAGLIEAQRTMMSFGIEGNPAHTGEVFTDNANYIGTLNRSDVNIGQKIVKFYRDNLRSKYETTSKTKYLHVAIKHVYCVVNGKNEVLRYDFE